jgi:hypothetical protein
VLKAGKLRVRAELDEPATVRLEATKKGRDLKVASGRRELEAGKGKIAAKLTSKGKRLLRKADKVRLKLGAKAEDAAGNVAMESKKHTLR